jgi:hypothetical protein
MICLPCGLAADLLTLARDIDAEPRAALDEGEWLAPVAALILHLHGRGVCSPGCSCQHRVGTGHLPGERHLRGAHESDDPVVAFMNAYLADDRLKPFGELFVERSIGGPLVPIQ